MNELIICVGISGSSKSTWTADYVKENNSFLRINRDDIRKTLVVDLNGYYNRSDLNNIEDIINTTEEDLIYSYASKGYNIIIDNTNLKQSYIKRFMSHQIIERDYNIKFKLFDISLEDARNRVAKRDNCYLVDDIHGGEIDCEKLKYIDKQYLQYQEIKKWLIENYKDKII